MLPPIEATVLKNNPRFEKLYNTITSSILNPDGSTKIDSSAKKRHAVRQELKAYRLKAARVHLLHSAISTAVPNPTTTTTTTTTTSSQSANPEDEGQQQNPKPKQQYQLRRIKSRSQAQALAQAQSLQNPSLPPDLIQLILLIPPFLTNASTLPASSLTLLLTSPPFTSLPTLFPRLLELVSARLTLQAKSLARVLSPNTNPSYIHRVIPSLPTLAQTLITDYAAARTHLSRARLAAAATLTRHLEQHTEALALLLGALDAKHGPLARAAELRAESACQEAQLWAAAAEALLWETRQLAYPPVARVALVNYRQHLQDAGRRLEDGTRVREAELADYGVDIDGRAAVRDRSSSAAAAAAAGRPVRGHRRRATVDENKERTMREMARVWREMETRLREIQGDLNRLR